LAESDNGYSTDLTGKSKMINIMVDGVTYTVLHSNPELVASATGYVTSTPNSIMTGKADNPNVPDRQRGVATNPGMFSTHATY
jgi:hypothetical protein